MAMAKSGWGHDGACTRFFVFPIVIASIKPNRSEGYNDSYVPMLAQLFMILLPTYLSKVNMSGHAHLTMNTFQHLRGR